MDVRELSREQLDELKQAMVAEELYQSEGRTPSLGELSGAADVPDERVFARYAGTDFVPDDFSCSSRPGNEGREP